VRQGRSRRFGYAREVPIRYTIGQREQRRGTEEGAARALLSTLVCGQRGNILVTSVGEVAIFWGKGYLKRRGGGGGPKEGVMA